MMETKFRGKTHDTGEWKYGYYAKTTLNSGVPLSLTDCRIHDIIIEDGEMWFIEGKTKGQYIGVNDGSGKYIYEGDIVDDDFVGVGRIEFLDGAYRINYGNGTYKWFIDFLDDEKLSLEVIGTIHDKTRVESKVY